MRTVPFSLQIDYTCLIEELRKAVEEENLTLLDTKVREWEIALNSKLTRQIWQELYLANPLALAVWCEKEKVIKHFVDINFKLQRPCKAMCKCELCRTLRDDSRFHQLYTSRILAALIEWDYVVVAEIEEPIESCLKTWNAIVRSGLYNGYSSEEMRMDLHSRVETTIIRCLDCTINENEVHILLGEATKREISTIDSLKKIDSMVAADMKRAVIHPAIQSLIMTNWTQNAHKLFGRRYRESKNVPFIVRFFGYLFVYLIIVPISIIFPHPRIIRFLKSPTTVYANEALSYWTFFIVMTAQYFIPPPNVNYIICKSVIEPIHYVLAVVMFARFIRTWDGIFRLGLDFFVSPYEMMQTISTCMYITGMTTQMIATYTVPSNANVQEVCKDLAMSKAMSKNITNITREAALDLLLSNQVSQCQAVEDFYELGPHYIDFVNDAIEPHNLASLFFAIGHLFYYLSAGNVLYMNRLVCHLNIAVTRMFKDVIRWGLLMILFYFAWSLAMVSLYKNYACENKTFSSVGSALMEMFWVLFAMTGTTDYVLSGTLKSRNHVGADIIEYTGFTLYGSYYIVAQIVLVNLLIAIMSVTFEKIDEDRITEITFWRSKIQLKYIFWHDVSAIPSPFNLFLPLFWFSTYVLRCARKLCSNRKTHEYIEEEAPVVKNDNRLEIVKNLLTRAMD